VEASDAVVLAAGRLREDEAARTGQAIKALVVIGGRTPLQAMLDALRASGSVARILVVGPAAAREAVSGYNLWLDERASGEDNLLAGLHAGQTQRVILCASDIPFVTPQDIRNFLDLVPSDAAVGYPIFEKQEFLARFPGGRDKFAKVGAQYWTGGSVCVVDRELALRNERLIRSAFRARRSQTAMASLLGPVVLFKHATGALRVEDVVTRLGSLLGGKAVGIRGANPRLAMDCDSAADIEYARSLSAGPTDA